MINRRIYGLRLCGWSGVPPWSTARR